MERGTEGYSSNPLIEVNTKVRDIEEKQRILKDRLLLIGQNLIETKEENIDKLTEIKKEITELRNNLKRIQNFLESISGEFSKFARKEDVEILSKQAKMFQPLEFVTRAELKEMSKWEP
jgi:predicted RNA binding protein with dsRBD fold (UPF0201 family)